MDISYPLMVVATAERKMVVVNLTAPDRIYSTITSPLKYQSRCVACFPDQQGFCLGSIEGRVAVHHVHERDAPKNFAFKCHRDSQVCMPLTCLFAMPAHATIGARLRSSPRITSCCRLTFLSRWLSPPARLLPLLSGHLSCQPHRVPPGLWHIRDHRRGWHLQLLG